MPELIISRNGKNPPGTVKVQSALTTLGATGVANLREEDGKIKCNYTTLNATKAQVAKALGGTEMDWEIDMVLCGDLAEDRAPLSSA